MISHDTRSWPSYFVLHVFIHFDRSRNLSRLSDKLSLWKYSFTSYFSQAKSSVSIFLYCSDHSIKNSRLSELILSLTKDFHSDFEKFVTSTTLCLAKNCFTSSWMDGKLKRCWIWRTWWAMDCSGRQDRWWNSNNFSFKILIGTVSIFRSQYIIGVGHL